MAHARTAIEKHTVTPTLVAGVDISHPERPIVEAPPHTKLDVVRYHERIGAWLVPQLAPRPIAVVKCMGGRFDDCFFQKHLSRRADEGDSPPFMRLADVADIVRTVQNGGFEFHTWGASFPRLDRPDRITLDLDPDTQLSWAALQDAASRVRTLLDELGMKSFVKTTGGKGLHFVLPMGAASCAGAPGEGVCARHCRSSRAGRPVAVHGDCGQGRTCGSRLRRLPAQRRWRNGGRRVFAAGAVRIAGVDADRVR